MAITARSGDLVIRSVTPTTGNVGQFQIIGLPTPQTYSITFEFPGYTSSTIALSLEAGQNRTGVDVRDSSAATAASPASRSARAGRRSAAQP